MKKIALKHYLKDSHGVVSWERERERGGGQTDRQSLDIKNRKIAREPILWGQGPGSTPGSQFRALCLTALWVEVSYLSCQLKNRPNVMLTAQAGCDVLVEA